ncbi:hypothetical protein THRCLA_04008 [Thraustotheca clavata]|uniref:Uncharacterized protein n=1 Tax=Thraustotheca clavata TaxID=74557 RepID=A0A1W0A088_9STRA|nr:hypothetical protein THRCLA_04008 [Thraustotheca clavata]
MWKDKTKAFFQQPDLSDIGSYIADLEVRERRVLKTLWHKRQIVLTGQTLEILDGNTLKFAFNIAYCTTRIQRSTENSFEFELREHGKSKIVFRAKTEYSRQEFINYLDKFKIWQLKTPRNRDTWTNLISVAEMINRKKLEELSFEIPRTKISVQQVQEHLLYMKEIYDLVATIPDIESLYSTFLSWEKDYFNGNQDTFACIVHLLHPVKYSPKAKDKLALADVLRKCPHSGCGAPFPLSLVYEMHILNKEFDCGACGGTVRYETYSIARFVKFAPCYKATYTLKNKPTEINFTTPPVPKDGNWTTMLAVLKEKLMATSPKLSCKGYSEMKSFYSSHINKQKTRNEGAFALDLVQAKFRQLDFINKMCPHFEYWMHPTVIEASIYRYEKFIYLLCLEDNGDVLVPTSDIDLVWHTHHVQHENYVSFCTNNTKGQYIIDHDDTIPGGDLAQGYATTFVTWSKTFNEAYSSFPPSYKSWSNLNPSYSREEWAKYGSVPQGDDRYYGVNESFDIDSIPYVTVIAKDHTENYEEIPADFSVYLTVIGTPVMDGRVRQPFTHQNTLMYRSGLPYYYKPNLYSSGCGGFGYYGSTDVSDTGNYLAMNSNDSGCSTGDCGGGGCASGSTDLSSRATGSWFSGGGVSGYTTSSGGGGCASSGYWGYFVSGGGSYGASDCGGGGCGASGCGASGGGGDGGGGGDVGGGCGDGGCGGGCGG